MVEGWGGDKYLILFDEIESDRFADAYGFHEYLPGYRLLGLQS